jgi:UDP-N-acetylglucosamine:LPS N-acetylglucosamine transferase
MKQMKVWNGTVINVYTDYFVNNLWGGREIDYHFAPCVQIKHLLVKKGVDPSRIFVTGIPVDPVFHTAASGLEQKEKPVVLISGGNMGAGSIREFIMKLQPKGRIHYKVLCGKNEKLFEFVKELNHPCIEPLPYIACKDKMNRLYEEADAIVTKPGGVTISECIAKNVPILVYDALPGQEEQNLQFLHKEKLVCDFRNWAEQENPESDILGLLQRIQKNNPFRTETFKQQIELSDPPTFILDLLKEKKAPGAS